MSFVAGTDWLGAQARLFAAALGAGLLLGCCWSLYGSLYRPCRCCSRRAWLLPDLIFSLTMIVLLSAYWFACTDGSLRPAAFLWLAGGAALWRHLPSLRLPGRKKRPRASGRHSNRRPAPPREPRIDPLLQAVTVWSGRLREAGKRARKRRQERRRKQRDKGDESAVSGGDGSE